MTARFTSPVVMEAEMVQAAASDSTGKAHSITTWVVLFLKSVLAVAVVGLLLAKTGASAVFDTLRLVPLSAALLACMLTMLQPLLGALRWHLIMRFLGGALTIAQTVRAFCWALSRQPCCRAGSLAMACACGSCCEQA